jgi:hypothetical protein
MSGWSRYLRRSDGWRGPWPVARCSPAGLSSLSLRDLHVSNEALFDRCAANEPASGVPSSDRSRTLLAALWIHWQRSRQ